MSGSRDTILDRIRAASPPATRPPLGLVERTYLAPTGAGNIDRFAARLTDYRAQVTRCEPDDIAAAVAAALHHHGARRVAVPAGLDPSWMPVGPEIIGDDPPLTHRELDAIDAALTTCTIAIAETGTIILDHGPGQGRRPLTLIPDLHVVIVPDHLVVAGVPDAITRLDPAHPQTWISGPSATSDIELNRVEGVHGPRTLHVILCATSASCASGG